MDDFNFFVTPASESDSDNKKEGNEQGKKRRSSLLLNTVPRTHEIRRSSDSIYSHSETQSKSSNLKGWAKIKKELTTSKRDGLDSKKKGEENSHIPRSPSMHVKNSKDSNCKSVKILVLGETEVGKSAFVVRYLTGKYIGEYDSRFESVFLRKKKLKLGQVLVEMKDTIGDINWSKRDKDLSWADAIVLIYSTTNKNSFLKLQTSCCEMTKKQLRQFFFIVIGNKKDLKRHRVVSYNDGYNLAKNINGLFLEISVADGYLDVEEQMNQVLTQYFASKNNKFTTHQHDLLLSRSSPNLKAKFDHHSDGLTQDSSFLSVAYQNYNGSVSSLNESDTGKSEKRGKALWQKLMSNDLKKQKKVTC